MNIIQNEFLGCTTAVRIETETEFERLREWMSINNLFLINGEPAVKMKYPGNAAFGIARDVNSMCVYWSKIGDIMSSNYKICSVHEFFAEEKSAPIDVDVTVKEEITDVTNDMLALEIKEKPEGNSIESNIDRIVELIPVIESKKNIVVTKDNYKDFTKKGEGLIPTYRKEATDLKKKLSMIKKSYLEPYSIFEGKVKMVIDALNGTADLLAKNCDVFEQERKNELRKSRQETIDQLKDVLITRKMISQEYADQFVFDEKWLNASCSMKRFKEEVEKQFNTLIEKERNDKRNLDLIEKSIVSQCQMTGIDEKTIKREKYLLLLQQGVNLGDIVTAITKDIEMIKKNTDSIIENQRKQQHEQDLANQKKHAEEEKNKALEDLKKQLEKKKEADTQNDIRNHANEKTGEVYAKSSSDFIKVKIQPNQGDPDKKYSYTFDFEGDFSSILTLNRFMQVLSEINSTFKFERK